MKTNRSIPWCLAGLVALCALLPVQLPAVGAVRDIQADQVYPDPEDAEWMEGGIQESIWNPVQNGSPSTPPPSLEGEITLNPELSLSGIPSHFVPSGLHPFSRLAFQNLPELSQRIRQLFEIIAFVLVLGGLLAQLRTMTGPADLLPSVTKPLLATMLIALLPSLMNQALWVTEEISGAILIGLAPDSPVVTHPEDPSRSVYSASRLGAQLYYFSESVRSQVRSEEDALSENLFGASLQLPRDSNFDAEHLLDNLVRHTRLSREGLGSILFAFHALNDTDRADLSQALRLAHQKFTSGGGPNGGLLNRFLSGRAATYAKEVEAAFRDKGIVFSSLGLMARLTGLSLEDALQMLLGRLLQMVFTACLWLASTLIFIGETLRFVLLHLLLILSPIACAALASRSLAGQGSHFLLLLLSIVAWPLFWTLGHIGTAAIFDGMVRSLSFLILGTAEGLAGTLDGDTIFRAMEIPALKVLMAGFFTKASIGALQGLLLLSLGILGWVSLVTLATPFFSYLVINRGGLLTGSLLVQIIPFSTVREHFSLPAAPSHLRHGDPPSARIQGPGERPAGLPQPIPLPHPLGGPRNEANVRERVLQAMSTVKGADLENKF